VRAPHPPRHASSDFSTRPPQHPTLVRTADAPKSKCVLHEVAWVLPQPVDGPGLEAALERALRDEYPDLRVTVTVVGDRFELQAPLRDGATQALVHTSFEIAHGRMRVVAKAADNRSAWYEVCRVARVLGRALGAALEREPQPALYALRAMDEPLTRSTPRFVPDGPAAGLFSRSDTAPYLAVDALEDGIAFVDATKSEPGNYDASFTRLLEWLFSMESEEYTVAASVLEPDPLAGLNSYEVEFG